MLDFAKYVKYYSTSISKNDFSKQNVFHAFYLSLLILISLYVKFSRLVLQ